MGGYIEIDEWFSPSLVHEPRTMLLIGPTGSGKSATGNRILGRVAFKSRMSPICVTKTVDCQTTTLKNGEVVNIIDTPGLFDLGGIGAQFILEDIKNCVELGRDGFHAVLLVCSVRGRFSEDAGGVILSLRRLFGSKITDYIVLVFTGVDDFEEDESLEGYLALATDHLPIIVEICKNRCVLFDNKTKDAKKKATQLHNLFAAVDNVIEANEGQAYTHCLFADIKEVANLQQKRLEGLTNEELTVSIEQMQKSYDEKLMQLTQLVEKYAIDAQKKSEEDMNELKENLALSEQKAEKLAQDTRKDTEDEVRQLMLQSKKMIQQYLDDEKDAWLRAEKIARDAQKQSEVEINELKENLALAEQKAEKLVEDARKETEGESRRLRQMMVETNKILQKQLDDERDAGLKAEIIAREANKFKKSLADSKQEAVKLCQMMLETYKVVQERMDYERDAHKR